MAKGSKTLGLIIGFIGPVIGLLSFGLVYVQFYEIDYMTFLERFFTIRSMQSPILAVSLWVNGLVFFIVNRKDQVETARGILLATFVFAPIIVYLRFF
ncbi:MAG: hypothetical protein ACI9YL_001911 [Luteibaculaceae bacterium]|jgi:hypothetical protein